MSISSTSSSSENIIGDGDIGEDLIDKLVFDDPHIFNRLRINDPSLSPFVDDCINALRFTGKGPLESLKTIVKDAEKEKLEDLEKEEEEAVLCYGPGTRTVRERKMYPHLEKLFTFIENFQAEQVKRNYFRRLVRGANTTMRKEHHTFNFPRVDPAFVCCESSDSIRPKEHRWHSITAFSEIKPSSKQGPKSDFNSEEPEEVPSLITQSASYARLHLSARPFQVFSVGFLIFGLKFCLAIFDRKGITFSPIHDIRDDLGLFIRIVYRLTCDLSPVELGQDPTVKMLEPDDIRVAEAKCLIPAKSNASTNLDFPTYVISLGWISSARWITVGPPIWISLSFVGRGTIVWTVCELNEDGSLNRQKLFVMKSAWRSNRRSSESDIYSMIEPHPGIAVFESGSDVYFPEQGSSMITVDTLRSGTSLITTTSRNLVPGSTLVLHRVFLKTLGRSLMEYSTEVQLLKAVRAAIFGYKHLCKSNMLHGDISIGNILLAWDDDPPEGHEGFLADMEYTTSSTVTKPIITPVHYPEMDLPHRRHVEPGFSMHTVFSGVPALRGAMMTGTVQFMATLVLRAIVQGEKLEQTASHDLQSFIWVLAYVVHRRLVRDGKEKVYADDFKRYFGQQKIYHILGTRVPSGLSPLNIRENTPTHLVSPVMAKLFFRLRVILERALLIIDPTPVTHEILIDALNTAIDEMQHQCGLESKHDLA